MKTSTSKPNHDRLTLACLILFRLKRVHASQTGNLWIWGLDRRQYLQTVCIMHYVLTIKTTCLHFIVWLCCAIFLARERFWMHARWVSFKIGFGSSKQFCTQTLDFQAVLFCPHEWGKIFTYFRFSEFGSHFGSKISRSQIRGSQFADYEIDLEHVIGCKFVKLRS